MADDDPEDDLDKEIAELEEEIAALEEGDAPEEEPEEKGSIRDKVPFLSKGDEEEATDSPQDDESDEDEASDDDGGPVSSLMGRFRGDDEDEEEEPAEAEPDEELEEAEDDEEEGSGIGGLVGRFRGDEDDEPTEPEPEIEPEEPAEEADAPEPEPFEEPGEAEETEAPDVEPDEEPEPTALEAGNPGETDDESLSEAERRRRRRSDLWERTDEGWLRLDPDATEQDEPPEEDDPSSAGPAALLARFRGEDDEEDEEEDDIPREIYGPPPPEEEEEGNKLILAAWIIGILLLLALIAAGAVYLLGAGGSSAPTASVTSTAITSDGSFVAATGQAIQFDASDTEGTVDEYRWDFGDGATTTTTEPSTEHTYTEAGSYTVTLTAASGDSTDEATLSVVVVEAPTAQPQVLFGGEPVAPPGEVGNNPFVGDSVTLDGSQSTADPNQEVASYEWDVDGDGEPDATGETAQTSFDEAGRWLVALTVTDDLGNTASSTQRVHVSDAIAFENETVGRAVGNDTTATHNVSVGPGRGTVPPVQLGLVLTYESGSDTGTPLDTQVQSDLDLSVTDPEGNEFTADEDEGAGQEFLNVTGADLANLGTWTVDVTHDSGSAGAGNEVTYTLRVQTIY